MRLVIAEIAMAAIAACAAQSVRVYERPLSDADPVAVTRLDVLSDGLLVTGTAGHGVVVLRQSGEDFLVVRGAERTRALAHAPVPATASPVKPPLPQSTYDDFARARPRRVRDNYTRESATMNEEIGPYQMHAGRFWFGKTFYDGEGQTGVGGFGYFDAAAKRYVIYAPPEVVDWSASAILVEQDRVWLGLFRRPEAPDYVPGGLLEYELASGRVRVHKAGAVILNIQRSGDVLYLGSSDGIFLLKNGQLSHYVFEPDRQGRLSVVRRD